MRGGGSMVYVARGKGARFEKLAQSMDSIGWRRYMEGMVSAEILEIQSDFVDVGRCSLLLGVIAGPPTQGLYNANGSAAA